MVRTKEGTSGVKVGGKAPRKGLAGPSASSSSCSAIKKPRDDGGNPYCPRETPAWQKPITDFFKQSSRKLEGTGDDSVDVGSSKRTSEIVEANESTGSHYVTESSKENINPQDQNEEIQECTKLTKQICETADVDSADKSDGDNTDLAMKESAN